MYKSHKQQQQQSQRLSLFILAAWETAFAWSDLDVRLSGNGIFVPVPVKGIQTVIIWNECLLIYWLLALGRGCGGSRANPLAQERLQSFKIFPIYFILSSLVVSVSVSHLHGLRARFPPLPCVNMFSCVLGFFSRFYSFHLQSKYMPYRMTNVSKMSIVYDWALWWVRTHVQCIPQRLLG